MTRKPCNVLEYALLIKTLSMEIANVFQVYSKSMMFAKPVHQTPTLTQLMEDVLHTAQALLKSSNKVGVFAYQAYTVSMEFVEPVHLTLFITL